MLKRLLKDSLIYSSGILVQGLTVALMPIFTYYLSPEQFGLVDLVGILFRFANIVVVLDIFQGVARFYLQQDHEEDRADIAGTGLTFAVSAYTIFVAVSTVFPATVSSMLTNGVASDQFITLSAVSVAMSGIFTYLHNLLRLVFKPLLYATANVVNAAVSICVSLALVILMESGAMGVIVGQLAGAGISLALCYFWTRGELNLVMSPRWLKAMLRYSTPLVPGTLSTIVFVYINRIAISNLMTVSDVGIYGVAHKISALTTLVISGLRLALNPLILQNHQQAEFPSQLAIAFKFFIAFMTTVCIGIVVFSGEIVLLLSSRPFQSASSVIPILTPGLVLANCYLFAPGMIIAKATSYIAVINISVALLSTGLNYYLIPYFGIDGAALATLVTSMTMFGLYFFYSQKFYPVPHQWSAVGTSIVLGLVLYISYRAGTSQLDQRYHLAVKVLTCILCPALLIAFRGVTLEELGLIKRALLTGRKGKA